MQSTTRTDAQASTAEDPIALRRSRVWEIALLLPLALINGWCCIDTLLLSAEQGRSRVPLKLSSWVSVNNLAERMVYCSWVLSNVASSLAAMTLQSLCISQTQQGFQKPSKKVSKISNYAQLLDHALCQRSATEPITCREFKSQSSILFLSPCFNKVTTVGRAHAMWMFWNRLMDLARHQFPLIYDLRNLMSEERVDVMQVTE
ncbi:hypothetical protein ACFX2I_017040 [Malus domestica]